MAVEQPDTPKPNQGGGTLVQLAVDVLGGAVQLAQAVVLFAMWSSFGESIYFLFGAGGSRTNAWEVLQLILVPLAVIGGWATSLSAVCCLRPSSATRRRGAGPELLEQDNNDDDDDNDNDSNGGDDDDDDGDHSHMRGHSDSSPADRVGPAPHVPLQCPCRCRRCCCCLPRISQWVARVNAYADADEKRTGWRALADKSVVPVAYLLLSAPVGFVRAPLVCAAVLTLVCILLAGRYGSLHARHVARAVVLVFSARWAHFSANVFLLDSGVTASIGAVCLVLIVTHHLLLSHVPPNASSSPPPQLQNNVATIALSARDHALVGVTTGATFALGSWVLLGVDALAIVSGQPSSRSFAIVLLLCVFVSEVVFEVLLTVDQTTSQRARPVVALVSAVLLVLGVALLLHAHGDAAAVGGVMLVMGHVLSWALLVWVWARITRRLFVVRVLMTSLFAFIVLIFADWFGILQPRTSLLLWVLSLVMVGGVCRLTYVAGSPNQVSVTQEIELEDAKAVPVASTDSKQQLRTRKAGLAGWLLYAVCFAAVLAVGIDQRTVAPVLTDTFNGRVRVLSFNIQRGYQVHTRAFNFPTVRSRVASIPLVGLQESHSWGPLTGSKDAMRAISDRTGHRTYQGISPQDNSFDGTAILSLYPFVACQGTNLPYQAPFSLHSFSACRVRLNSTQDMLMVSMHPTVFPRGLLQEQVSEAAHLINQLAGTLPVVVVGDFNAEAESSELASLVTVANLTNVFNPQRLPGVEYPITRPGSDGSIDHIFFRGFSSVTQATVLSTGDASDHLAVFAELAV